MDRQPSHRRLGMVIVQLVKDRSDVSAGCSNIVSASSLPADAADIVIGPPLGVPVPLLVKVLELSV